MKHSICLFIMGLAVAASVARGQTTYQAWNTPGTYLWLCPLGVTNVQAECWGGGGGGGGLNVTVGHGSGGGGAGGYARKNSIPVTPGHSYMITIPAAAGGGDTNGSAGTNGSAVSFTGDGGNTVTAYGGNGGHGATSGNGAGGAALGVGGTGGDVYFVGGAGAGTSGNGGGGGSGPSDLANGTNGATANGFAPGATGSDAAHNGGPGASFQGSTTQPAYSATTPPGGGGGGASGNSNNKKKIGGAGAVGQIILTWSGSTSASLGTPACSFVSDSTPPNYNLATTGTQDWQIYGDTNGYFNLYPSVLKTYGSSINLQLGSYAPPCGVEQTSQRSAQTYTWTGGAPMETGTNIDAENNGFICTNVSAVGFYSNYETVTFKPGDTNIHRVYLYGYVAGDNNGLSLQFSNSLTVGGSTVFTTNPPLGDFNYSFLFQAQNASDALTVTWTFAQTNTTGSLAYVGIQAAAMDGTSPVPPVNWRVIADDTNFPTSDTVVAGVVAGDVINGTNTLPADPANQDCSAYFQAAINWLSDNGGGTMFVPAGHYKFTNNLAVTKAGVVLRGRWVQPGPGQPVTNCTIFDVCVNSNVPPILEDQDTNAFITVGSAGGLRDLTFWYPNQNPTNPVPYPYTVWGRSTKGFENVTLVNSYAGMDLDASGLTSLRGLYGTTLEMGVRYQNGQAVPRADTVNLSPDYWSWSGLPGAPTNATTKAILAGLMLNNTNCIGLEAENTDCFFFQNAMISGYHYGICFRDIGDKPTQPEFYNVVATNCTQALRLAATRSLQAINCTFGGTTNGYGVYRGSDAAGRYTGCTIYGGAGAILCGSGGMGFGLNLEGCTLSNSVTMNDNDSLILVGSRFLSTGTNVYLNNGVSGPQQAVIAGNVNCGPANVALNLGSGDQVVISTNPVAPVTVPYFPIDYPRTRKAGKTNLFNVFAFGARGDGVADDTAAVQAALAAANANQGGIVFFPVGTYNLTQSLSVSNGVELRGIFGSRHVGGEIPGSLLSINANAGTSNGPAFITLYGQSGMRGFDFVYPNQDGNSPTPYPYMIQCSGGSNYVVDVCGGSDYQGVDLNGAKAALVEYCHLGGVLNIFRIRGGSTDCRIQNLHVKPGSWWNNGNGAGGSTSAQENTFIVEDCTNLTINSIFNHGAHTMLIQRGGTGQALILNGEQTQRGYVFETAPTNGVFNFMGCNGLVSDVGDGTGRCGWWLQSNYVGTVSVLDSFCNDISADYTYRVDNANACLILNNPKPGGQQGRTPTIRAVGKVVINNAGLGPDFTVDVPAGGQLVISNSVMNDMPCGPQPGYQNWSNNCIVSGHSFIAANLVYNPPVTDGLSLNTNNLGTELADGLFGWHLLNGSTNFLLDVTSPPFTNGQQPNVTFQIIYYENSDGHLSLWYDSTNGLKLGATYTLYSTNSQWTKQNLSVSDARFSGTNDIVLTVDSTNCDPVLRLVQADATSYLGVPPQILPTQFTGTLSIFSPSLQGQTNLVLNGNVGSANGGLSYSVWGTTNLVLPSNQWSVLITNVFFNPNGGFSNALPIMPGAPQMFYRLRVP